MRTEHTRYCLRCGKETPAAVCPDDGTPTVRQVEGGGQPILPGTVIDGRYRVQGELGRGGFGMVLDAVHVTTGHPVAIKLLSAVPGLSGLDLARRFFHEAAITSRLTHPATVRVYDYGQTPAGDFYLAMERLNGETLQDVIDRRLLSEPEAVAMAVDVLRSLGEAHELGLVHRDLKPANIFFHEVPGGDRVVKVLDFGIVKHADAAMTQAGQALGTPTHMAPEQSMGRSVDRRADLYALGVVLFEALTGELPFVGETPMAILLAHIHEPVPVLAARFPGRIRPALAAVIERALAKLADERFASAAEMRAALQHALGVGSDTAPVRVSPPPGDDDTAEDCRVTAPLGTEVSAELAALRAPAAPADPEPGAPPADDGLVPTRRERKLTRTAAPRLTACAIADDASRAWWAEAGARICTAQLPPWDPGTLGDLPLALATLGVLDIGQPAADVTALVVTPDGRTVISGALDGSVAAWDAVAGVQTAVLRVAGSVSSLGLSSDGTLLVVGSTAGGALLAELPSLHVRRELGGHREVSGQRSAVTAVAVQGARRLVATAGMDGVVRTWDPVGGGARLTLRVPGGAVTAMALGKDAQWLAIGSQSGVLSVWQTRTGQQLWQSQAHQAGIAAVALDRAGAFVASAAEDGRAQVFRVAGGERLAVRDDFAAGVRSIAFVDGALAALAASWDGTLRRLSW